MSTYKCQACGFTVYNRRHPKCESCGVVLLPGIALSAEERNALFESDRAAADAAWRERERKRSEDFKNDNGGAVDIPAI
jgi:predicted RNA-binding Zn-ribbon protein involved in translation (DUF1610 family)